MSIIGTLDLTDTYTLMECPIKGCGVHYALTDRMISERRQDHGSWYCPNGHSLHFAQDSEAEKLKKRLAWEKELRGYDQAALTAARDQAKAAEYARRAQKAANTRLKKKIAAGVCPCCKRNFVNVREHMAGQHPDFALPKDAS